MISVTSSVMQFQYEGFCINILDTPGHQDFSEDTYRTLMAADSGKILYHLVSKRATVCGKIRMSRRGAVRWRLWTGRGGQARGW